MSSDMKNQMEVVRTSVGLRLSPARTVILAAPRWGGACEVGTFQEGWHVARQGDVHRLG